MADTGNPIFGDPSTFKFRAISKPSIIITSPATSVSGLPLTLEMSYVDPSGSLDGTHLLVSNVKDASIIYNQKIECEIVEKVGDTTKLKYTFKPEEILCVSGETYRFLVTAISTSGYSGATSIPRLKIEYDGPEPAKLQFYYNDEVVPWLLEGQSREDYSFGFNNVLIGYETKPTAILHSIPKDESQPVTESNFIHELLFREYQKETPDHIELYRCNPSHFNKEGTEEILEWSDPILLSDNLNFGSQFVDKYCPLNTDYKYIAKSYLKGGEVSVSEYITRRDSTASFFMFGDDVNPENVAYLVFNVKESISVSNPQSSAIYYADREWPVNYSMPQLGMSVSVDGNIYHERDERTWYRLWRDYDGVCYYKSHRGLCFHAKVTPKIEHEDNSLFRATISVDITRIDGEDI